MPLDRTGAEITPPRGTGLPLRRRRLPVLERAARFIDKTPTCWLWTGHTSKGYGTIRDDDGRTVQVHRLMWEAVNGPMPTGRLGGHRCPGGPRTDCVNPAHIEPLTYTENLNDRYGGLCGKGIHDLSDPANVRMNAGQRRCAPCYRAKRPLRGRRMAMCRRGLHELTGVNVALKSNGERRCRTCKRDVARRWQALRRAADPHAAAPVTSPF